MNNENYKKDFLGKTLTYKTEVNSDGQALWTKEIDHKFSKWLFNLREENRELFKVQFSITANSYRVPKGFKKELYFSPIGMRDVEAYSQLTGLSKSKVVLNAFYSVLLILRS
jgi:hypothetical protein